MISTGLTPLYLTGNILIKFLLVALCLILTAIPVHSKETVKIALGDWEPFTSSRADNSNISEELVREAFKYQNIEVEYQYFPWIRSYKYVEKGEFQATFPWVITEDRKKLFKILGKNFNTAGERVWLKRRFKEYKIEDRDLSKLKMRMDIIPVSIALAQAANESGWGTSRFALEGNALFGQWTWSKKGISPKNKDPDSNHKILQFQILKASVRAYKNNLNTHNAYKEFREVRARLRQDEKQITGLDLTKYLKNYAAIGEKYVAILEDIIKNNSLTDFDKANLLPTKLKQGIAL